MKHLFKRRPEIKVHLQREPFYLGGLVGIEITVTTHRRIRIQEGRIELSCGETYYALHQTSASHVKFIQPSLIHTEAFLSESEILPGQVVSYKTTIPIPEDAPPTLEGKTVQASWTLKVHLTVPMERDVSHVKELVIRMPIDSNFRHENSQYVATPPSEYEQCALSLALDDVQVIGGKLNGEFVAKCWQTIDVREVRVELERTETARLVAWGKTVGDTTEKYRIATQVISRNAKLDQSDHRWPLDLYVPNTQTPSISTKCGSRIHWRLRGVIVKRGLLPRVWQVEKELCVMSAEVVP